MLEHQPENTFYPSFQQKIVLLRNWWLRKVENMSNENRLVVGEFTECGKAMRLFDSSPIIKCHDAYTLETADGITIRIEGFINKIRTLDNGFPLEACKTFLISFPTTRTDFSNGSLWDKSSHADICLSASSVAEWSNDYDARLHEAIRKFTALVSSPAHVTLLDISSHQLPEKNINDKNWDESHGANTRDAHTNNHIQDDEGCAANLRDDHTGNNDIEAGHTPVDNDPENHEASYTKGVRTET